MRNTLHSSCSEIKRETAKIEDPDDKLISECMFLVISALETGADVNRLAHHTGLSREFIEEVTGRMHAARLWIGRDVDDREWWDKKIKEGFAIFVHALVAKGDVTRHLREDGTYQYVNVHTGVVDWEWRP